MIQDSLDKILQSIFGSFQCLIGTVIDKFVEEENKKIIEIRSKL